MPKRVPGIRFTTYGYDTKLYGSKSFQITSNIALTLVQTMVAIGWSAPSSKPIVFLAHSLGGIILKQALIMLAGGDIHYRALLAKVKGAILFGVPSEGMRIPDLFSMLGTQPNTALLEELSDQSTFLHDLDEQFGNITFLQGIKFIYAFETEVTPSVQVRSWVTVGSDDMRLSFGLRYADFVQQESISTGRFTRTGPATVMVSPKSATRNLHNSNPDLTIQIDENHSNMVKFATGDHRIVIISRKMREICGMAEPTTEDVLTQPSNNGAPVKKQTPERSRTGTQPEWSLPGFWNNETILASISAPERDLRLETIDDRLENTLDWAYDDTSTGLTQWLQKGSGVFWIHGKPASGKSTLMKFLYTDPRTSELLHASSWKSGTRLITLSFFFHHRGTIVQRSFEGLLRSLVSQILGKENAFFPLLYPILEKQYQRGVDAMALDSLEGDIWTLLAHLKIPKTSRVTTDVASFLEKQRELTNSQVLGQHLQDMLESFGLTLRPQPPQLSTDGDRGKFPNGFERLNYINWKTSKEIGVQPTSWGLILTPVLSRHSEREKIKLRVETEQWSRTHLEDALRRLLTQKLVKMDFFMFLDALDEYDGRPEFIISFLQDLVAQLTTSPMDHPKTRAKILFSSRPWKAFVDEFTTCPRLQIQDYTHKDIRDFCVASIPNDNPVTERLLAPFVPEIVNRACGVFLWVKLVMHDLVETAQQTAKAADLEKTRQRIRRTLESLPGELEQYYRVVIERIPAGLKWNTYVVLETLCRTTEEVDAKTMAGILLSAQPGTLNDAGQRVHDHERYLMVNPDGGYDFKMISGGLVEMISLAKVPFLQFMHQTVKDFAMSPEFKFQTLGTSVGRFVKENGHSFIAKYSFVKSVPNGYHLEESEITTGFSQYDFFKTAPEIFWKSFPRRKQSIVELAVAFGLQLCIDDAHDADPRCIKQYSDDIAWLLYNQLRYELKNEKRLRGIERLMDMAESLVAKGMQVETNSDGIEAAVLAASRVGRNSSRMAVVDGYSPEEESSNQFYFERLSLALAKVLPQQHSKVPRVPKGDSNGAPVQAFLLHQASDDTVFSDKAIKLSTTMLHANLPNLTQALVEQGVDPNLLDEYGSTPLDHLLERRDFLVNPKNPEHPLRDSHRLACLLVSSGGMLRQTRRSHWNEWAKAFASQGLDCAAFQDAGFPLWLPDIPSDFESSSESSPDFEWPNWGSHGSSESSDSDTMGGVAL